MMDSNHFSQAVNFCNQAFQGAFFKPNIVFLSMTEQEDVIKHYEAIIKEAARLEIGILLYAPHPKAGYGQQQYINIWISDRSPDWHINGGIGNLNLPLLISYKLEQNWKAKIRLLTITKEESEKKKAEKFMKDLVDMARLPDVELVVRAGEWNQQLQDAPYADLNIFGLSDNLDLEKVKELVSVTQSTCLFVRDSGIENALA